MEPRINKLLERMNAESLEVVENHVNDFVVKNSDSLINIYHLLTPEERLDYPKICFEAARRLITKGDYATGWNVLQDSLEGYKKQDLPDDRRIYNMNRVRLMQLHVAIEKLDIKSATELANTVLETGNDKTHEMAALSSMARIHTLKDTPDPKKAIEYWQKSIGIINKLQIDETIELSVRHSLEKDKLQILIYITDTCYRNGFSDLGAKYHQELKVMVSRFEDKDEAFFYRIRSLVLDANFQQRSGNLNRALELCDDARLVAEQGNLTNDLPFIDMKEAEIRLVLGQDDKIRDDLDITRIGNGTHVRWMYTRIQKALFMGQGANARRLLEELEFFPIKDFIYSYMYTVLNVAVDCQLGELHDSSYQEKLKQSIDFFSSTHMYAEASISKLTMAWASKMQKADKEAKYWLGECIKDCRILGDVSHIWRWYLISAKELNNIWFSSEGGRMLLNEIELFMQSGLQASLPTKARVHFFGKTELWIHGHNHLEKTRSDSKTIPILLNFLMAQDTGLSLDEITSEIWGDATPRNYQLFHATKSNQKILTSLIDYDQGFYYLNQDYVDYADVVYVRQLFTDAYNVKDQEVKIFLWFVALGLTNRPLAPRIQNNYVESVRDYFAYQRAQAILELESIQGKSKNDMVKNKLSDSLIQEAKDTMAKIRQ